MNGFMKMDSPAAYVLVFRPRHTWRDRVPMRWFFSEVPFCDPEWKEFIRCKSATQVREFKRYCAHQYPLLVFASVAEAEWDTCQQSHPSEG